MSDLLVVEDDEAIGDALSTGLRAHGHSVSWERTAHGARSVLEAGPVDLVLLDLGLPDLDGVELCRWIRSVRPATVIIMLTARSDEMDVVLGLEAGADDYLTKPFRFAELLARIRAHLRRSTVVPASDAVVTVGSMTIDLPSRRVSVGGTEVPLRNKEFELLARLARDPGSAVTREALMADVWDAHWFGPTKTLDVHVAALRRKLTAASGAGEAPRITTLRGHGYRLEAPRN